MLGAVIPEFGRIELRELPDPKIERADDLIVRVAAAGVCRTDLETMDGGLASVYGAPTFPYVPGHETAGVVEEVGSAVSAVKPGDRVLLHPFISCGMCHGCRSGRDMYCTNNRFPGVDARTWGGFAEKLVTGQRAVIPLSDDDNLVELSPYTDAGITAYHAIKRLLPHLEPGSTVVSIGVGGVGHFAVQLLRIMTSCTVVAFDVDPARASLATELGAHLALSGLLSDHEERLKDMTNGGVDAVMDFAGVRDGGASVFKLIRKGGILSLVGAGHGLQVDTLSAVVGEITIIGNLVGTYNELRELVALQRLGLRSLHTAYALSNVEQAVSDLRAGAVTGRAVLIP